VVVLVGVLEVVVPPALPQAASRKSSVQPIKEYNSWLKRGLYIWLPFRDEMMSNI
jgi:hypothetical protein